MKPLRFSMLAMALISFLLAGARAGATEVRRNIAYANDGEKAHRLDLYLPESDTPKPLIVWIHGGAWRSGSKDSVPIKRCLSHGWAIASVEYRLSPVARFPAQMHDIKAAIRFLRANASAFGLDEERFTLVGSSAGGHLAALAGLSNGDRQLEGDLGEHLGTSSKVQSIVSYFGASNFETILSQSTDYGLSVRIPALKLFLGGAPGEVLERAVVASPVHHVDENDPPVLLIHGDADPQMPYEQSLELLAVLKEHGVRSALMTIEGGLHGGDEFYDEERTRTALDFIEP